MNDALRVLIVEDEILLAMQLEYHIMEAGGEVVGSALTSKEALDLARDMKPELIFVDINLADGPTGLGVARALAASSRHVVVFMTANAKRIPADFAGAAGVIGKPYTRNGIREALAFMRLAMKDGAAPPPPDCLVMSPKFGTPRDGRIRFATAP